ncbi:MAG: hypothetical protein Q4C67_01765 [Deinococcus sp.]|nr:hypothetical protein [Deinococcus sp.]
MKKALMLLAITPLALASCDQLGIPNGDVSGTVTGTAPTGKGSIKLALGSLTLRGIGNSTPDQIALGTFNPGKKVYAISLPASPQEGGYDVFAYADSNSNGRWDNSEPRTRSSSRGLIYSAAGVGKKDGSSLLNLKPGWTQVQNANVVKSGKPFRDYNLSW